MNPPYQPSGPHQAFPQTQTMPPPDGPPSYHRPGSSQLQLPAPRQLLQYADSYHQALSQGQPHHQNQSSSLSPHPSAAPPPQHFQLPHHQTQQLSALGSTHASRTAIFTAEAPLLHTGLPAVDVKPGQAVLASISNVDEAAGYKYQLDVVQQPKRARMCGFGDKDRRPITPPPCVRLSIIDIKTCKEINYNEIDHAMFVLNVDLWSADGMREVNLVRSSGSASSSASASGYASRNGAEAPHGLHGLPHGRDIPYPQQIASPCPPDYASQPSSHHYGSNLYQPGCTYASPSQHYPPYESYRQDQSLPSQNNTSQNSRAASVSEAHGQEQGIVSRTSGSGAQLQGMFTRNLIGSVAVSAFNLCDTEDKRGIWFVLQDLSVRTEGNFRLRFSFVNVGPRGGRTPQDGNPSKVITGRAPILASSYSEIFSVFSAKKFPGVCESTALSKTFAAQGIKIPIRKEAGGKGDDDDGYGD